MSDNNITQVVIENIYLMARQKKIPIGYIENEIGVTKGHLSRIKNGYSDLKLKQIYRIMQILDTKADVLMDKKHIQHSINREIYKNEQEINVLEKEINTLKKKNEALRIKADVNMEIASDDTDDSEELSGAENISDTEISTEQRTVNKNIVEKSKKIAKKESKNTDDFLKDIESRLEKAKREKLIRDSMLKKYKGE